MNRLIRFISIRPAFHPNNKLKPSSFKSMVSIPSQPTESGKVELICRLILSGHWSVLRKTLPEMHPPLVSSVLTKLRSKPRCALRFFIWVRDNFRFDPSFEAYGIILCILSETNLRSYTLSLVKRLVFGNSREFMISVIDFLARNSVRASVFDLIFYSLAKRNIFDDLVLIVGVVTQAGYVLPLKAANKLLSLLKNNKELIDSNYVIFSAFKKSFLNKKCSENSLVVSSPGETAPLLSNLTRKVCSPKKSSRSTRRNSSECYVWIIRVLCIEGKVGGALFVLERMCRKIWRIPDTMTCNYILNALCKSGNSSEAYRFLREFLEEGLVPNTCTYNIMLHNYSRCGSFDDVLVLLVHMIKKGIPPNAVTCKIIVKGYCDKRKLEDAKKVVVGSFSEDKGVSLTTSTMLVKSCFEAGDVSQAFDIWKDALRSNVFLDVFAYNVFINGILSTRRKKLAFGIFADMHKKGVTPDLITYNTFISWLSKDGHLKEACTFHDDMAIAGIIPDHISYRMVVHGLCLRGNVYKAYKYVEKMLDAGMIPDPCIWNILIYGYVKVLNIDQAYAVVEKMHQFGHRPSTFTYNALIHFLLKAGNFEGAFLLKHRMLSSGCKADTVTYNLLISGVYRFGYHMRYAFELYREILENGIVPDVYTYTELISGCSAHGRLDEAEKILEKIESNVSSDYVPFHVLIKEWCRKKELKRAYAVYKRMVRNGLVANFSTYRILVATLIKYDYVHEACLVATHVASLGTWR